MRNNALLLSVTFLMLASVLAERRRFAQAVVYAEDAVAIFTRKHGETNSFVVWRRLDLQEMRLGVVRQYLERFVPPRPRKSP